MYAPTHASPRGQARGGAARAYAQMGVESSVLSASPYQLMTLLFDAALAAVSMARLYLVAGDVAQKGKSISRASNLIQGGLLASLDRSAVSPDGLEMVDNLEALYGYMLDCLLRANLHNDVAKLDEAGKLLENIASAWREIGPQVTG